MKNLPVPEVSLPDASGLSADVRGLAESAADAISNAAGFVPGLDDYRAVRQRRRRLIWSLGTIGLIVVAVLMIKKSRETGDADA